MNSCLENIVTINDPCEPNKINSSSGYDIMDAPEISNKNISQIANLNQPNGYEFLKKQLKISLRDVVNDFIALLNSNNLIANLSINVTSTGSFNSRYQNKEDSAQGISLYKNQRNYNPNSIKKLIVKDVLIFPINDVESTKLYIVDGNNIETRSIQLVGGKINKFSLDYKVNSQKVDIYLKNIATYSSNLTCLLGCGGRMPNDCGYVKGYNNGNITREEGFGINANFSCECDYESLLCRFSRSYIGNVIFLKTRINILKERMYNDRLNSFIIYGKDEAEKQAIELENEYREVWNSFVQSVPNLLSNDSDCINCKKTQVVVNI